MPLIIGKTAGGVLVPILVDANGVVSVSSAVSSLPSLPAGDNNIGNVDVVTLPALPAGDNNIGNVDIVTLPALVEGSAVIGKVLSTNYGLIGGVAHKDPIRLGYSGDKSEQVSDLSADAGTNTLNGATVPAGEIWVIEAISARNVNKSAVRLLLQVSVNSVAVRLLELTTTAAAEFITWTGAITLSEGDKVQAVIFSCDADDDIYLQYHGRRIDTDQ